jgi:hypothetical protein
MEEIEVAQAVELEFEGAGDEGFLDGAGGGVGEEEEHGRET